MLDSEITFKIKVTLRLIVFKIFLTLAITCPIRLSNIFKTTNVTILTKVILESSYRVLQEDTQTTCLSFKGSWILSYFWHSCNFYVFFLQIVVQFFKLKIYLIKSSKSTHIWLQFVVNILLWSFRLGSFLKSIKNTKHNRNTHTYTTRTQTHKTEKTPPVTQAI